MEVIQEFQESKVQEESSKDDERVAKHIRSSKIDLLYDHDHVNDIIVEHILFFRCSIFLVLGVFECVLVNSQ